MNDSTLRSLRLAGMATAAIFVLLLLAPWVPPNAALFGAVALLTLWGVVFFGGKELSRYLSEEMEARREAKQPDEGTPEYIREQYRKGELSDEEMQEQLEEAVSEEQNVERETN